MPSLTGTDPSSVANPVSVVPPRDDPFTPALRQGAVLLAPSGHRWTVRALHPGQRVELVDHGPTGPIGMIIDEVAAARMIPISP